MRCRVSEEHTAIEVVIQQADSPHYAAKYCVDCEPPLWLKWLSLDEALSHSTGGPTLMEDLHEVAEEASEDVRAIGIDLSAAMTREIRLTVRDEMARLFELIAKALK